MSAIPFTDRELRRAWRELLEVATPIPGSETKNPHRLLMFYAVECGLKAVWMKRNSRSVFDREDIDRTGHDLRQVIKELGVGDRLSLPDNLRLLPFMRAKDEIPRNGDISILHQAWRYGGKCQNPTDLDCEKCLEKILVWIKGELR